MKRRAPRPLAQRVSAPDLRRQGILAVQIGYMSDTSSGFACLASSTSMGLNASRGGSCREQGCVRRWHSDRV